jgi:hypothetical protein
MSNKSLWGDLKDLEKIKVPKNHLTKQADLLSEATDYVLTGEVTQDISTSGKFSFDLDIVAPALNNYRHTILSIIHGINPYPLRVNDYANNKTFMECKDEESFLEILGSVLSSPSVRRIISSLIAQSEAS